MEEEASRNQPVDALIRLDPRAARSMFCTAGQMLTPRLILLGELSCYALHKMSTGTWWRYAAKWLARGSFRGILLASTWFCGGAWVGRLVSR
jgi:hypothetical protein